MTKRAEVASYVALLCTEMGKLAHLSKLEALHYLLDLAQLEATCATQIAMAEEAREFSLQPSVATKVETLQQVLR